MIETTLNVAGADRPIYVAERPDDLRDIDDMLIEHKSEPLAFDIETVGTDPFSPTYRVRLVQFGTMDFSTVIPVELGFGHEVVQRAMSRRTEGPLLAHNAKFDILGIDTLGLIDVNDVWNRTVDTMLLSHLIDPRDAKDGGIGQGLKELSNHYFDPDAADLKKRLVAEGKRILGKSATIERIFAEIPLFNEVYLAYSANDTFLGAWLFDALQPLIAAKRFTRLSSFEHEVARICSLHQRKGMAVDEAYTRGPLATRLLSEQAAGRMTAERYGISNVNSVKQKIAGLEALGVELTARTKKGNVQVNKDVLEPLAAGDGPAKEVAGAILSAMHAGKLKTSYVDNILERLDVNGRVHPDIRSLKARTARMAVAEPALQQLPSDDWIIRWMFEASEGHQIFAVDFSQIELRVMAALTRDRTMMRAFVDGADMHAMTAAAAHVDRSVGKMANFLTVYGGGASKLAVQASIPFPDAKRTIDAFQRTYPGVKRLGRKIQEQFYCGQTSVITPTGRHLPMDRQRIYAGLNYLIQSTARDVLAQALIMLDDAGLNDHIMISVHDEVIGEAPTEDVEEITAEVARIMTVENFLGTGIDIPAEGDVYGDRWGGGYRCSEKSSSIQCNLPKHHENEHDFKREAA